MPPLLRAPALFSTMPRLLLVLLLTCTAASATGSNHTAAAGEGEAGAYGEGGTAPQGVSPVAAIHVQQDVFGQDDAGFAIAFNGLNDIAALRSGVFNLTDPGTAGLERAFAMCYWAVHYDDTNGHGLISHSVSLQRPACAAPPSPRRAWATETC